MSWSNFFDVLNLRLGTINLIAYPIHFEALSQGLVESVVPPSSIASRMRSYDTCFVIHCLCSRVKRRATSRVNERIKGRADLMLYFVKYFMLPNEDFDE